MDDIPEISTDELVRWLDAKYRRHGEIEDGIAARRLESLTLKLGTALDLLEDLYDDWEGWNESYWRQVAPNIRKHIDALKPDNKNRDS